MKRKITALIAAVVTAAMLFTACGAKPLQKTYDILQDEKFGGVHLLTSIDDFTAAGFQLGDSCDISFSNGFTLEDIPFYSGYYTRSGAPLIVGYPGAEHVVVTRNNEGLWEYAGLKDNDTAVVTLNERGKYLKVENALDLICSNDRADYQDDAAFANFRAMRGGRLKENMLYRGGSPVDDSRNRAAVTDRLLKENGIGLILDLADSEEDFRSFIEKDGFCSHYSEGLYEEGRVVLLGLGINFASDEYMEKLAEGLRRMMTADGPVYIHCTEGRDRTGFVCMLLEGLAGASYEEMVTDYMKTYENCYGITKEGAEEKYDTIVELYFDAFAACLCGTEDKEVYLCADYEQCAEEYLLKAGMTAEEIDELRGMIKGLENI